MNSPAYSIASVEADTGLSKDVLRMWERRYGFPNPERDKHGERLYPLPQVEKLRLIKRLMDQGHRPGKLMTLPEDALQLLTAEKSEICPAPQDEKVSAILRLIEQHDLPLLQLSLQQALAEQGLKHFITEILAPLINAVGQAWEIGRLNVFEEHLFSEQALRLMRQALAPLHDNRGSPCILLTTVPDEQHILGLVMAEALFSLEGACCLALGSQTPLLEIAAAAKRYQADVVALSFSSSFPLRRISGLLQQLRDLLPAKVAIWSGGAIMQRVECPEGVLSMASLDQGLAALNNWRSAHYPEPAAH